MFAMSPTITLKGALKFSIKKLIAAGEMAHSHYTGPGELLFAPPFLGDITTLRITGKEKQQWYAGKEALMAWTQGVTKEYKNQGLGKAMFSGEGLFVVKVGGVGLAWLCSFGAIIRKDVSRPVPFPFPPCLSLSLPLSFPPSSPEKSAATISPNTYPPSSTN